MKNEPEGTGSKADDAEGKKADEEDGAPKAEVQDADAPKQEGDAEAYSSQKELTTEPFDENGNLKSNVKYESGEFGYKMETDGSRRLIGASTDNLQFTERTERLNHNSKTRAGEHLRNYENGNRGKIDPNNNKSPSYERKAFDAVRDEFKKLAEQSGEELPGGPIHHNNWPIEKYSDHATDPKNLYPTEPRSTTQNQHMDIHRETTGGSHPTRDPISPKNEKPLYDNNPRPYNDNDND